MMGSALRHDLPPIPARMRKLPVDARGYPVPWFVAWQQDLPDFRAADEAKWQQAVAFGKCWICGEVLGRARTFVIGPMCVVNRLTSEPPSHWDCADFAARACPFLTLPKAKYRSAQDLIAQGAKPPAGDFIARNPGVACLWTTADFWVLDVIGGRLLRLGEPEDVAWYAGGRQATRDEIVASVTSGLPILEEAARLEGAAALEELKSKVRAASRWYAT